MMLFALRAARYTVARLQGYDDALVVIAQVNDDHFRT
jgi:hypothetical protein